MKNIIDINTLPYTSDLFYKEKSVFESKIVIIIASILLFFLGWITFGKREEVVQGIGIVKPTENISVVKNSKAGEIEKIYFFDGQNVKKGDVLFKLKTETAEASEENLVEKIKLMTTKAKDVNTMIESFYQNKNIVPENRKIAFSRMKAFFEVKNNLEEITRMHEKYLNNEKQLPEEIITGEKLYMLEQNLKNAKIKSSQFSEQYLSSLLNEKEMIEIERNNLQTSLIHLQESIAQSTVTAPIDGQILINSSLNVNDYVFANKNILTIVPNSPDGYNVFIKLPAQKAGKIEKGMKVKLRFPAFSYFEYGGLDGKIINITPDSISTGKELFYVATVKLSTINLKNKNGDVVKLKTGLQADAKIIMKEETILSHILKKLEVQL